jgi:selenide, water dikinase
MKEPVQGWPKLTSLCSTAGAGSKLRADVLGQVLGSVASTPSKSVVPHGDAVIVKQSSSMAWVSSLSVLTPIIDNPVAFGRIVAAHALSSQWVVGATPMFATSYLAMPKETPPGLAASVLEGVNEHAASVGVVVHGGHSQQAQEFACGLSVIGQVLVSAVTGNAGARAGDQLVLTKPIGTGIASLALKRGVASPLLADRVVRQMVALNDVAAGVLVGRNAGATACTDVGGFGLLGASLKLARASSLTAQLYLERIPILPAVAALADQSVVPLGSKANLAAFETVVRYPAGLPEAVRLLLNDPQTSGGLLAAVGPKNVKKVVAALAKAGVEAWAVGQLVAGNPLVTVVSE